MLKYLTFCNVIHDSVMFKIIITEVAITHTFLVIINTKLMVSGVQHNGRVAAFGPGDPGSNPGEDRYIIEFKSIIQVVLYE